MLKAENPALAQHYNDTFMKRTEFDQIMEEKVDNIEDIVKFYPGGPNGPEPEDNPEHYSKWFLRNHPDEFIYGKGEKPNHFDLGVRWKYL